MVILFPQIFFGSDPTREKSHSKSHAVVNGSPTVEQDNQTLLLQIESLQAQLEEQTKLSREEIEGLLEDRRVRSEEHSAATERDQDKIKSLTEKLHKTQDLLYQSAKDFLELKYDLRARERQWMIDRDRLVQEIEHFRQQVDVSGSSVLEATGVSVEPQVILLSCIICLAHVGVCVSICMYVKPYLLTTLALTNIFSSLP